MCRKNDIISLDGDWLMEWFDIGDGQPHLAYKPDYQPINPIKYNVPGIVQNALYENGIVDDPYFEKNNEKLLWTEDKEWWFFKDIEIPTDIIGEKYYIVFEGINYYANIWLDGISLGNQEGMFIKKSYDITHLIKPGTKHRLTLRVRVLENSSEDRPGGKQKRGVVWSSGVTAPFSYWWNWAPHLVPIGLWKSVYLKITGGINFQNIFVKSNIKWNDANEPDYAELDININLKSDIPIDKNIILKGEIKPLNFNSEYTGIFFYNTNVKSNQKKEINIREVINKPELWWPNGLGNPNLYSIKVIVEDDNGNKLDEIKTQFGIREIKFEHNKDDEWVQAISTQSNRLWSIVGKPHPWTFIVNKQRIFIKGSNFLPTDSLFRFTRERYELFLEQARESNLNMLRVWGGGIYETEIFFDLCDRKGILLWIDFWLSCADYPLIPQDLFIKSAENMITGIRNHPSVTLWCGGNEYNPDAPENKYLVDKLEGLCNRLDSTRPFHRGSPYKGDRHGGILKLPSRTSNKYNGDILNGDQRLVLFRSEVAVLRSAPVLESIQKFIDKKHIWPIKEDIWEYHHAVILEQRRDSREYNAKNDIEHWIMATQLTHAINRQYNLEYARISKYRTSGILEWSLNGCWPSFHREMIDYYGIPKPVFYAYKRAAKDYLVAIDMEKYVYDGNEKFSVKVYVVNDTQFRMGEVLVEAIIYDTDMKELYSYGTKCSIEKDESKNVFTLNWVIPEKYLESVLFVYLKLSKNEILLADNFYWFGVSAYNRVNKIINLDGHWEYQVNTEVNEFDWQDTTLPSYWKKPQEPPEEGKSVFYRKEILIPDNWKDTELEIYSAGIEGNDEIYFNGNLIGTTEEEMSVLLRPDELTYTEELEEKRQRGGRRMKTTEAATNMDKKGELKNVRISADPFTTPNLIKRFYKIPKNIINFGEKNVILIRLYGDYATGISETIFIREASTETQKNKIIEYYNKGQFFKAIGDLPEVKLKGEVLYKTTTIEKNGYIIFKVKIKNITDKLAFFVNLKVVGVENRAGLYLSDNFFQILPYSEKKIEVKVKNNMNFKGEFDINFIISGWNIIEEKISNVRIKCVD